MRNERREDEKRRREAAQAGTAEVEGGHEVVGRSIKQMVSVRLEAQLLTEIRELAERQGVSISELLRQAAVELVRRSHTASMHVQYRRAESRPLITSSLTLGDQISQGAFEDPQVPVSSGSDGVLTSC
jgi:uncharacterized protein (DUF4415 family)